MESIAISSFDIVDYCIDNYYYKDPDGGVYLVDAFKDLHEKFGWTYPEIHKKFYDEVQQRRDEVFITRCSPCWLDRNEKKILPVYNNQYYSHLMKMNNNKTF